MTSSDWLRFAFLGLHPEKAAVLLSTHGGVAAALRALDAGIESGVVAPPLAECVARLRAWGGAFDHATGSGWIDRFGHVEDAPRWLFRQGDIGGGPLVAIVGTRQCTEYGRRLAHDLAAAVTSSGWGVVSGLARGIDAAAHRGAIDGGGPTIAVLGSGPDIAYPRQHVGLRRQILDRGAVVSEYPPGAAPLPWRFPPRNRIISGLASAVVVVESGVSGGSLSTVARALAQGRTILAVPGDVDRVASVGCNRLIRDGAVPVLGPDDLVEALSLLPAPGSSR